jgi:hypothetical protein
VDLKTLAINWVGFFISNALLGAAIMMLWKGTLPPPMSKVKVHPLISTTVLVAGTTTMLVFGTPGLLQQTIETLTK